MEFLPKSSQFVETLEDYQASLHGLLSEAAEECQSINRRPKEPKSSRLVDATLEVFELIGGVPRFALWADQNLHHFYTKNFAKAASIAQNQINFNGPTQINIQPALPRSPLDGEDTQDEIGSSPGSEHPLP